MSEAGVAAGIRRVEAVTAEGALAYTHEIEAKLNEAARVYVELVKADWTSLQSGLSTGRFDANHTLLMYLLRSVDSDLDVKITGGIHTGCLRIQAGVNTDIKTVDDLRGKTIGVPAPFGSPPHMFASRVLAAHGISPLSA